MRLAQQVPYYQAMQEAHSKLDHVTASVRNQEYIPTHESYRGHIAMNGFDDKKVTSDIR